MVGRTARTNYGWVPGHGALNAALTLDCVLGQAREVGHPIFMLFLDLAQFFPSIQRVGAVDISSYHARAALEHHGDNTMIRHRISSAIRKPPLGPMPTKLIPAYHGCINQYHVNIMNENSY